MLQSILREFKEEKIEITSKNGETKRMWDLSDALQRQPVLPIKGAVFDLIQARIHPVPAHGAGGGETGRVGQTFLNTVAQTYCQEED